MLETLFGSVLTAGITAASFTVCLIAALALGALVAAVYMYKNTCTQSMAVTLALLPAMVQVIILLVNGNLGAGVAVSGAFGLVRFRSAPGSARDITCIFLAMTLGLATGMGSLYNLHYHVTLVSSEVEKQFLDAIRCRNGNLDIVCGKVPQAKEAL
ncbi:DUF4956 domain-containing protein [Agathobaculum sp.]|uniref:DUF4956 domain-containing protein n=1 Tax=Agathobaculum sp. TaxID=2048138 RepID=UPI003AB5208A